MLSVTEMGAVHFVTRPDWPAHPGSMHVDGPVQTVNFSSDMARKKSGKRTMPQRGLCNLTDV